MAKQGAQVTDRKLHICLQKWHHDDIRLKQFDRFSLLLTYELVVEWLLLGYG